MWPWHSMNFAKVIRRLQERPDRRPRQQYGKELEALPIASGIDDLTYDPATRRIYAAANGVIDVFEQTDLDHYVSRGSTQTGTNGRTAKLVPQLNRLFFAVPSNSQQSARVLVYEPINTPEPKLPPTDAKEPVNAPRAEEIVLESLCPIRFFAGWGCMSFRLGTNT